MFSCNPASLGDFNNRRFMSFGFGAFIGTSPAKRHIEQESNPIFKMFFTVLTVRVIERADDIEPVF